MLAELLLRMSLGKESISNSLCLVISTKFLKIPQDHHSKMRISTSCFALLSASCLLCSCGDPPKNNRKERFEKDDYFSGSEISLTLGTLKNEMADSRTDYSKSFAKDPIPWQKWDQTLLEKSKQTQSPIFAFVGSSLGGSSRSVAEEIAKSETLRELIVSQSVCTVVDIHSFPEIGSLGYHLSNEIQQATAFPMIIWLSHEGSPLAWIPIGDLSGRELEIMINNASAMVKDIWSQSSQYAVENSRSDNEARQRRFDFPLNELQIPEERNELFRRNTRKMSALYSFGDKDLDYIGGLIPTNSLTLLALGSNSKQFTGEVRQHCRRAAREVTRELIDGAIKDHLDGSYFYARRTTDWSLPSFSKNISSQARVASMLLTVGTILQEDEFIAEGLALLDKIENNWVARSTICLSPVGDQDAPGKFFWDFETLEKVLTPEEISVATSAYSLEKSGNIPAAVDPLGNFYEKNTLTRRVPISEIASKLQMSETEITEALSSIQRKLLDHRSESTKTIEETVPALTDVALILKAQIARSAYSQKPNDLATATATAERILKEFNDADKGLSHHPSNITFLQARCSDYAATSLAFFYLYQQTLDEKWLKTSRGILDEAMVKLESENGLLAESISGERVIPIRQHSISMIFGESSIGILDHVLNRIFAVTGDDKYRKMSNLHSKIIAPMVERSTVNHTDFLASCALGQEPLIAVLHGDAASTAGKELLAILNSPKHLPYLTIRPLKGSVDLAPLPEIPTSASSDTPAVALVRGQQILGNATGATELVKLLNQIISDNGSE